MPTDINRGENFKVKQIRNNELKDFDNIFRSFEDSVLLLNSNKEKRKRRKFSHRIEELIELFPSNADLYHKLGLCLFNIEQWSQSDIVKIEIAFTRALLLDPNSKNTRMLLIFFYFDTNYYYLAINSYHKLTLKEYESFPCWRRVRLLEVLICSLLRIDQEIINEDLVDNLNKLRTEYSSLDRDDLESVEPQSVVRELTKYQERVGMDLSEYIKLLNAIKIE